MIRWQHMIDMAELHKHTNHVRHHNRRRRWRGFLPLFLNRSRRMTRRP